MVASFSSSPLSDNLREIREYIYDRTDDVESAEEISIQKAEEPLSSDSILVSSNPLDLSQMSIALIGVSEAAYRKIAIELKKYGFNHFVHIPAHTRESRHQVREKISNCSLIIVVNSYVNHSILRTVKLLKDAQVLSGEVIYVSIGGRNELIREVVNYFSTANT